MRFPHVFAALSLVALIDSACHEPTSSAEPARVTLNLTPDAAAFVVGTTGHVGAQAFDRVGHEIAWTGARDLVSSDSSVLQVAFDSVVIARSVGFAQLRVSWPGPTYYTVSDSVSIAVGYRGSGTVRNPLVANNCWTVQTGPTTSLYVPTLPAQYRVVGLRVRIVARPQGGGDFCMVGTGVLLDSIAVDAP
jgi:hypothetical protein